MAQEDVDTEKKAQLEERERRLLDREEGADLRDRRADQRERAADRREESANQRETTADEREVALDADAKEQLSRPIDRVGRIEGLLGRAAARTDRSNQFLGRSREAVQRGLDRSGSRPDQAPAHTSSPDDTDAGSEQPAP